MTERKGETPGGRAILPIKLQALATEANYNVERGSLLLLVTGWDGHARNRYLFLLIWRLGDQVNKSSKAVEREDKEIKRRLEAGQMSSIPLKTPKVVLKQSSLNLREIVGT